MRSALKARDANQCAKGSTSDVTGWRRRSGERCSIARRSAAERGWQPAAPGQCVCVRANPPLNKPHVQLIRLHARSRRSVAEFIFRRPSAPRRRRRCDAAPQTPQWRRQRRRHRDCSWCFFLYVFSHYHSTVPLIICAVSLARPNGRRVVLGCRARGGGLGSFCLWKNERDCVVPRAACAFLAPCQQTAGRLSIFTCALSRAPFVPSSKPFVLDSCDTHFLYLRLTKLSHACRVVFIFW